MAGIDKIYGNKEQFAKLYNWCLEHRTEIKKKFRLDIMKCLYYSNPSEFPESENDNLPLSNFSQNIDFYLWDNCNLDFVQERLHSQYNEKPELRKKYEVTWFDEDNKCLYKSFDKISECFDFIETLPGSLEGSISTLWTYPIIRFWFNKEQNCRVWDSDKMSCIRLLFGKKELVRVENEFK